MILDIQRDEFALDISAADQPDIDDVDTFYRSGGGEFWVARHQGDIVGTIAAIDIGDGAIALRKMFVAPAHRGGAGLAARLMAVLVDWAAERGSSAIYLGTTAVMLGAHRFYEKHGYTRIAENDLPLSFPRMAVDSVFFRRSLTALSAVRSTRSPRQP